MIKKILTLGVITSFAFGANFASASENTPCTNHHLDVVSDTSDKVIEIKIGANAPTNPNTNAVLVSTVPAIQMLAPGVWAADVGNVNSKWIWSEDMVQDWEVDKWATFEKEFTITGTPTGASLNIAADNSYEVWVNGNSLASDNSENNHSVADNIVVPIGMLNTGLNKITFKVLNMALPGFPKENNPAGLIYYLSLDSQSCCDNSNPECCGSVEVKNKNEATVINSVTTSSNTGANVSNSGSSKNKVRGMFNNSNNSSSGNGGSITTGDSSSVSNVVNKINKNVTRIRR